MLRLLVVSVHIVLAVCVSAHIVLTKSDVRSAIGWTGLVWLTPVFGSVLYFFLGVNRIRRRAVRIRSERRELTGTHAVQPSRTSTGVVQGAARRPSRAGEHGAITPALAPLATLVGGVTGAALTEGNAIEPLVNGDAAFPAMLAAIESAERSVALATYIFDRGKVADRFLDALESAVRRGVQVRILIDGVGARYSHPPIVGELRERGVPVARFLPSRLPVVHSYFNLRNHRKILVVDGTVGFCGGMNIRDGCLLSLDPPSPTADTHFRLRGPVVQQLMSAFAFDWQYTTHEALDGAEWLPPEDAPSVAGSVLARGIADGPDETFEALLLTFLGALAQARHTVRIVTPYFLPDPPVLDALTVAALRGVQVEILLPERGNLRAVQWAQTAQLGRVLAGGCRIFLTPAPFDHSKLFVVDGEWTLVGSANWDPRSLRLNFEYVVECYSRALAAQVEGLIDAKRAAARELTRADLDARRMATKLRDGAVWLMQPYL